MFIIISAIIKQFNFTIFVLLRNSQNKPKIHWEGFLWSENVFNHKDCFLEKKWNIKQPLQGRFVYFSVLFFNYSQYSPNIFPITFSKEQRWNLGLPIPD